MYHYLPKSMVLCSNCLLSIQSIPIGFKIMVARLLNSDAFVIDTFFSYFSDSSPYYNFNMEIKLA